MVDESDAKPITKWKIGTDVKSFCATRVSKFKRIVQGACGEGYKACANNICVGADDDCPIN